ncbi:MAG: hypothetical protein RKE49_07890 [Oceanicaulis sp.]
MDHVSIDAAEALSGEESFILQLRPPVPPGADEAALAGQIDQFTALYLSAAGPQRGRFAQLAPLTWAIAASRFDAEQLEQVRGDLSETLFGSDLAERVQLARQPVAPVAENCADHPSAAARAAFDDENDTFDLDAASLNIDDSDVFEVDAWRVGDDADHQGAEPETAPGDEPDAIAGGEPLDAELDAAADSLDFNLDDETPDSDVLTALAELERAFTGEPGAEPSAEQPAAEEDSATPVPGDDWDLAEPSTHGAPEAEDDFDARAFEADLDAFEVAASDEQGPAPDEAFEPEQREAGFDQLTEAPQPRASDVAAEIAAFREEMRAIAESIPGGGAGDALTEFREEIEAIAGAVGQCVDGAAQRIEAAAERITAAAGPDAAERLNGAAARAEQSAALMETSVEEAVRALKAVLHAAGAETPRLVSGDGR